MIFRRICKRKAIIRVLLGYLDSPSDSLSTATIMSLVYDYEASGVDDPIVAQVERTTHLVAKEMRLEIAAMIAVFPLRKSPHVCVVKWIRQSD